MTDSKTNEVVEAMARAISEPLANMTGGCFMPDNGRSQRGECADGDCYCARVAKHCARAAITASEPLLAQARAQAVEDAAKVAETYRLNLSVDTDFTNLPTTIAAAIRALAQSEGEGKA
jgi:hypothetical protein